MVRENQNPGSIFFVCFFFSHKFLLGQYTTLDETDVWDLSPTIQSRPIFVNSVQSSQQTAIYVMCPSDHDIQL